MSKVEVLMYEYQYNIIYYNIIIPVLVITSWIFGWFTIHLVTFYVLFLTLVSLTFHNSNFDNRVTSHLSTSIQTVGKESKPNTEL